MLFDGSRGFLRWLGLLLHFLRFDKVQSGYLCAVRSNALRTTTMRRGYCCTPPERQLCESRRVASMSADRQLWAVRDLGDRSVPTATLLVFAARPTGAWGVPPGPGTGVERHLGTICGLHAGKLGTRLIEYRRNAVRDQIGCFKVDFVNLLIRELAVASVYFLKRHQEDHRRPRLFVGLSEQSIPSIRS